MDNFEASDARNVVRIICL